MSWSCLISSWNLPKCHLQVSTSQEWLEMPILKAFFFAQGSFERLSIRTGVCFAVVGLFPPCRAPITWSLKCFPSMIGVCLHEDLGTQRLAHFCRCFPESTVQLEWVRAIFWSWWFCSSLLVSVTQLAYFGCISNLMSLWICFYLNDKDEFHWHHTPSYWAHSWLWKKISKAWGCVYNAREEILGNFTHLTKQTFWIFCHRTLPWEAWT